MKLIYWVSNSLNDHECYNIRAKTKKACQAAKDNWGEDVDKHYGPVHKIEIHYIDGFNLMIQCRSEGRVYEDFDE